MIKFLKQLRPIFKIDGDNSQEVTKLLIPKVTGQLFTFWMNAVSIRSSWETLQGDIINYFLTPLRLTVVRSRKAAKPGRVICGLRGGMYGFCIHS